MGGGGRGWAEIYSPQQISAPAHMSEFFWRTGRRGWLTNQLPKGMGGSGGGGEGEMVEWGVENAVNCITHYRLSRRICQ